MSKSMIIRAGMPGLFIYLLMILASSAIWASDDNADRRGDKLETLKRESDEAFTTLQRRRDKAKVDAEKEEAVEAYYKTLGGLAERAFALVECHPNEPVALEAVLWVIQEGRSGHFGRRYDVVDKAYELLARQWINSEDVAPACCYAANLSLACPEALHFLREAMDRSPYPQVRGVACLGIAQSNRRLADAGLRLRDPVTRQPLADLYAANPKALKLLEKSDPEKLHREAEALLRRVIAEFGDARMPRPYRPLPLGGLARGELFRLRNLSVGRAAPDLDEEDMDAVRLKLSDYRGKVVAIVFWATWCEPCMAMVPHERELVKRLEGKPFVLLGVNCDEDRDTARSVMVRKGMAWRSWWGGGQSGSIASRWGVTSWPTIYILDAKGVIRYESISSEMMDKAIDRLLKEDESRQN